MEANEFLQQGSGIITLCGSTRFFFEAMEANRQLTFQNWIVLACGSWGHSYHKYVENTNNDYESVKRLHFYKIGRANAVVVVTDSTHYYGKSTEAEIKYAEYLSKPVFFFDGNKFFGSVENNYIPSISTHEIALLESFEEHNSLGMS